MSGRDQLETLDQKIADSLQSTADELRQTLDESFERSREAIGSLLRESGPPDLSELLSATAELAAASSEQEILATLVGTATRFCDRAIFFVVDINGARSWSVSGFPDETSGGISFDDTTAGVWRSVTREQAAVFLSTAECGEILARLEVEPAARGALIPLALGDHIAGALYADATSGPGPVIAALQLLTQSAGQMIESLSMREPAGSPSLRTTTDERRLHLTLWNPAETPHPET